MKLKGEFCKEGKDNYIHQMILFSFQGKQFLAICRKVGLIQLYENHGNNTTRRKSFKLYKEWKNSTLGPQDPIKCIGFINHQYLYSCSSEGKLVFRDLINDDADNSFRVFLIHKPVSKVDMQVMDDGKILVASSGNNNELKIYEVDMNSEDKKNRCVHSLESYYKLPVIGGVQAENRAIVQTFTARPDRFGLRRRMTSVNLNALKDKYIQSLVPVWVSSVASKTSSYCGALGDSMCSWIVSICIVPGSPNLIICGSQFGTILIYDTKKDSYPFKVLQVSQFPIYTLKLMNNARYLFYIDTMSRAGVIKLSQFLVVSEYGNLKFGPLAACDIVANDAAAARKTTDTSSVAMFDPVYCICSTIDSRLLIYRFCDDSSATLLAHIRSNSFISCLNTSINHCPYGAFASLFGSSGSKNLLPCPLVKRKSIGI